MYTSLLSLSCLLESDPGFPVGNLDLGLQAGFSFSVYTVNLQSFTSQIQKFSAHFKSYVYIYLDAWRNGTGTESTPWMPLSIVLTQASPAD